ncbi:hypothetical protein N9A71_06350 [Porticoccaceae bacterium]|nr:hypothetical protein [Porticoccaceae bacterium]
MNDQNETASDNNPDDDLDNDLDSYPDLQDLLDHLDSLQNNLLSDTADKPATKTARPLPKSLAEENVHNLEIPFLSDIVDDAIDSERQLREQFHQAQQHLFEKTSSAQPISEEQINTLVNTLMTKMRPRIDQLLRDKIRGLVIERFN